MANWLNENSNRAYPLVDVGPLEMVHSVSGLVELPDDVLVDMTVIVGAGADYDAAAHRIYLYSVTRLGDVFTFKFKFDHPTLDAYTLTFCRNLADGEFATDYRDLAFEPPA